MSDLLHRELAPISQEAWDVIDGEARRVLCTQLSARRIVDVEGPLGWEAASVNTGRLSHEDRGDVDGVLWGVRETVPLLELRVPFALSRETIRGIERGAKRHELGPVEDAARRIARFEESVIYNGFAEGAIGGIGSAVRAHPLPMRAGDSSMSHTTARAVRALQSEGIDGPYAMVLPAGAYQALIENLEPGFPLVRMIQEILGGPVLWSPGTDRGVVISKRGGDFELTLGGDLSVGYTMHSSDSVELYFIESFAFRVLEPLAAFLLDPKAEAAVSREMQLQEGRHERSLPERALHSNFAAGA
jgi:uncharacterized linocin/CFP29 family protein